MNRISRVLLAAPVAAGLLASAAPAAHADWGHRDYYGGGGYYHHGGGWGAGPAYYAPPPAYYAPPPPAYYAPY